MVATVCNICAAVCYWLFQKLSHFNGARVLCFCQPLAALSSLFFWDELLP